MNLNDNECKVLAILADEYSDEGRCYYFRSIAALSKLTIKEVRRACRSLAKKGFAKYERGLFNDDGEVAGSGYGATEAGAAFLSPCDVCGALAVFEYDGKLECEKHHGKSTKQAALKL